MHQISRYHICVRKCLYQSVDFTLLSSNFTTNSHLTDILTIRFRISSMIIRFYLFKINCFKSSTVFYLWRLIRCFITFQMISIEFKMNIQIFSFQIIVTIFLLFVSRVSWLKSLSFYNKQFILFKRVLWIHLAYTKNRRFT